MKICVYFQPKKLKDNFEGARLRKNIKGALELANIEYAKNIIDEYDIIHFISIDDEAKINDSIAENKRTVFSAFVCETDESARLLSVKNDAPIFSSKALRVLNNVDVVFVPNETSRNLLVRAGITSRIEIVSPGVNLSRFEFADPIQEKVFYNYFRIETAEQYVVSIGTYEQYDSLKPLIEIANRCPKYTFFFFGQMHGKMHEGKIRRLAKKMPKNLKLCPLAVSEIYCSMMKHASVFLSFDNSRHAPLTLLDAAASKTQIVALKPLGFNEETLKKTHAIVCENIDDVASAITKLMEGTIENHCEEAYNFACENSLTKLGKRLNEEYTKLLKGDK